MFATSLGSRPPQRPPAGGIQPGEKKHFQTKMQMGVFLDFEKYRKAGEVRQDERGGISGTSWAVVGGERTVARVTVPARPGDGEDGDDRVDDEDDDDGGDDDDLHVPPCEHGEERQDDWVDGQPWSTEPRS